MDATQAAIVRGLTKTASKPLATFRKVANARWLDDSDLTKLCGLFKQHKKKAKGRR